MSERVLALIHYYAREGLYRQVQNVCNEVLKTRSNDSTLVFWRAACGILPEGNTSEVWREREEPIGRLPPGKKRSQQGPPIPTWAWGKSPCHRGRPVLL